jgi:uncharacterized protein (DUF1697 family)
MADLRDLLASLGYSNVRTLLNSGNVVFTAPAKIKGDHGARIEAGLAKRVGISSRVIVLSAEEVATLVAENSLAGTVKDFSRLLVFALAAPGDRERLRELAGRRWAVGELVLGSRAAFVWSPDGLLDSAVAVAVGKALGDRATSRNWATMLKIDALLRSTTAG